MQSVLVAIRPRYWFEAGTAAEARLAGFGCVPGSGECVAACGGGDGCVSLLLLVLELGGVVPLISLLLAPLALESGLLASLLVALLCGVELGEVEVFGC